MSHKVIFDIIHGNIEISGFESLLLKNPIVNRLHQVLQNSTAYTVFPNLKASRFEHSLGSMNNAGKMYNFGIINSKISTRFLNNKKEVIVKLITQNREEVFNSLTAKGSIVTPFKKHLKGTIGLNPDFNNLNEIINSKKFNSYVLDFIGTDFCARNLSKHSNINIFLFQTVRLFGLLHDIGHLPLSHLFEYSIDSVYKELLDVPEKKRTDMQKDYLGKLEDILTIVDDNYPDKNEQIHEKIGKNIIKFVFQDAKLRIFEDKSIDDIKKAVYVFIIFILEKIWDEMIKGAIGALNSIYTIVSNTVDADRLDYVRRDGTLSGIAKASGNFDRIIEMFCLGENPESIYKDSFLFMPSIQSLSDVEELLHQRFRIYKYMVNHHAVARSNYIFQKVIQNQILKELKSDTTNKGDSSNLEVGNLSMVIDIASDVALKKNPMGGAYYTTVIKFIQLTDFWLLSTLNKQFIATCDVEDGKHDFNQLLLKEIYEHRKNYRSLWKRNHQYHDFLKDLGNALTKYADVDFVPEDKSTMTEFKMLHDSIKELIEAREQYDPLIKKITETKELLNKLDEDSDEYSRHSKILKERKISLQKFNLSYVRLGSSVIALSKLYKDETNWIKVFETELLNDGFNVLIKSTKLKTGIDKFYLIDKTNQDNIHKFDRFSLKNLSLKSEVDNSIGFFVFYNINDSISSERLQKKLIDLFIENLKKILIIKKS